jgi:hypothetical protein
LRKSVVRHGVSHHFPKILSGTTGDGCAPGIWLSGTRARTRGAPADRIPMIRAPERRKTDGFGGGGGGGGGKRRRGGGFYRGGG